MSAVRTLASDADRLAEVAKDLAESALMVLNESGNDGEGLVSPRPFGVFAERHETPSAVSYSSWFNHWGGFQGAAHSVEAWPEDRSTWPEWTQGKGLVLRPGGLDIALFGCTIPGRPPQGLRNGDRVRIRGYVAGTEDYPEVRNGTAYMDRPEDMRNGEAPSWIIKFDAGEDMAHGGMSGGPVTVVNPDGTETLVAVLVTQNGRADLDGDGVRDNSSDVVELVDAWQAVRDERMTASA